MLLSRLMNGIFSAALFLNALLFILQAIKIFKSKKTREISLLTFLAFFIIQFGIVCQGVIQKDKILIMSSVFSLLATGLIVTLTLLYKKKENLTKENLTKDEITLEALLQQFPGHVYWKNKEGIYLGCNERQAKNLGLHSTKEIIGKTDIELSKNVNMAKAFRENDLSVMNTGRASTVEENVIIDDVERIMLSQKTPLKKNDQIIGILGVSIDITLPKQEVLERFHMLNEIIAAMPGHVYWMDKNGFYLGCNDNQAIDVGLPSREAIVGKRNVDIPRFFIPDVLDPVNQAVMKSGMPIFLEEPAVLLDGRDATFMSNKVPLKNSRGEIIGLLGISMDITERKKQEQELKLAREEAEAANQVKLESQEKIYQARIEEQEKFKKIVEQMVHDIRSPIATMQMILSLCHGLSEKLRVPLNQSAVRVFDIANNLLNRFIVKEKPDDNIADTFILEPTLISAELLEIITEKKYEYSKLSIDFQTNISSAGYFSFINTDRRSFKRMMSNLINNAVDACKGRLAKITVFLDVMDDRVQIIIQDNGLGMPEEIKTKILNNIAVTSGKEEGHGIGFGQIRATLEKSSGTLNIVSKIGRGTKIILSFPKIETLDWIADKIELNHNDLIVILDDDDSIHGAWDVKFEQAAPHIERKHFKNGNEAVLFINKLSERNKSRVFLLTDYELLNQSLHGLDVVNQTGVKRSILVTSHHHNQEIRDLAYSMHTQILPKPLASEVSICLSRE